MTPEDAVLVEILAATDAVWAPLRVEDWNSDHAGGNLYAARRDFPTSGVRWASGASEENERKRSQRRLEKLAGDGLVAVVVSKARTVGTRLSDAAEWRARALCDLPTLADAHEWTGDLAEVFGAGIFVNECCLYSMRPDCNYPAKITGRILWIVQAILYPALCRDFVFAGSDCHGRTYYMVTPEGARWAAGPAPEPPADLPAVDEAAVELYADAWNRRRREFQAGVPPCPREIGLCPLPVGCPLVRAGDGYSDPPRRRARKVKSA